MSNSKYNDWESILQWIGQIHMDTEEKFHNVNHKSAVTMTLIPSNKNCVSEDYVTYYKYEDKFFESKTNLIAKKDALPNQIISALNKHNEINFIEELENMASIKNFDNSMLKNVDMNDYVDKYSDDSFWKKIKGMFSSVGLSLLNNALKLFYLAKRSDCPPKVRAGIIGAFAYLISPLDLIPDFIPVVGYTDDGGAILMALAYAQVYINDEIKQQAKDTIRNLIGDDAVDKLD